MNPGDRQGAFRAGHGFVALLLAIAVALALLVLAPGRSSEDGSGEMIGGRAPLLPDHRIVTFYGNPRSRAMGILGLSPPDSMLRRLEDPAAGWAAADPALPVLQGLHLVAVVAQSHPGADGMYRARMPKALVGEVLGWTEPDSLLLFLDIQPGRSSVLQEARAYHDILTHPRVHLALDPEFAMGADQVPGRVIGSLGADAVNEVIDFLAGLVEDGGIPPKILVVHRFTAGMLPGAREIRRDPRMQVVLNMNGFGNPRLKRDSYRTFVATEAVQFTGFKLFYRQDIPLMPAAEVLALRPVPHLVIDP